MVKTYWIFSVALATLFAQATGDIGALEEKIKLLETRISGIQATENKMEIFERRLEGHDARLEQLESKPSLCSQY